MVWVRWGVCLMMVGLSPLAGAQEYRISAPERAEPVPVVIEQPLQGRVEITNYPEQQEVRVVGGRLDEPLEVRGEVQLSVQDALPVEVLNPLEVPRSVEIEGAVRVDDVQPLRVLVTNPPPPVAPPAPPPRYAAYVYRGSFSGRQTVLRRTFAPPPGTIFELTDVVLRSRPEAVVWVRVLASAAAVAGELVVADEGELALLVLDPRSGAMVAPATPVPLRGGFTIEVETLAASRRAAFEVLLAGRRIPVPATGAVAP